MTNQELPEYNIAQKYQELSQAIVAEHESVFRMLDMDQLREFMDLIIKAKHVFIHAVGREGIALRGFAMRLAHLGKRVYWLFDDTTIGMHEGDLFIISAGGGDVGVHRWICDKASKSGATVAMLTALPEGNLVQKYADFTLFIHATAFVADTGEDMSSLPQQHDVVPTVQPMGNLYEQHIFFLMDIVAVLLKDAMGLTYDDMEAYHRNVE